MLIRNEKNQLVNTSEYANEILSEGLGHEDASEQDAQDALAELYLLSNQQQFENFITEEGKASLAGVSIELINKRNLWEQLRQIFCSLIQEDGVFEKIIEFILDAIATLIPLGVFVKRLVKIIIKFFLKKGVQWACPS